MPVLELAGQPPLGESNAILVYIGRQHGLHPKDDLQAAYHEASTQTGTELDKRLIKLIVKAQKQDEDAFDDMSDDAYDNDIRGFAAQYLRPVQEELAGAKEVADAVADLP